MTAATELSTPPLIATNTLPLLLITLIEGTKVSQKKRNGFAFLQIKVKIGIDLP